MNTGLPVLMALVFIFVFIVFCKDLSSLFYMVFSPRYELFKVAHTIELFDVVRGNTSYTKMYQYRRHIKKGKWQRKVENGIFIDRTIFGKVTIKIIWKWEDVPDYERGILENQLRNK